jgi:hypothetical protein
LNLGILFFCILGGIFRTGLKVVSQAVLICAEIFVSWVICKRLLFRFLREFGFCGIFDGVFCCFFVPAVLGIEKTQEVLKIMGIFVVQVLFFCFCLPTTRFLGSPCF